MYPVHPGLISMGYICFPLILSKYRLPATAERCTLLAPLKHEDSHMADVLARLAQRLELVI